MPKLLIHFAGTGDKGDSLSSYTEQSHLFDDDVIRVYIRGCGTGKRGLIDYALPELDHLAQEIKSAFDENGCLKLDSLIENLGSGLVAIHGSTETQEHQTIEISDICLTGFSRGAVTTFAVAKELDKLNIPIQILANQPVPGQVNEGQALGLYQKYCDLTGCQNIKEATTLLATHNLNNGELHDQFFKQMVAKFPDKTEVNNYLLPLQYHLQHNETEFVTYLTDILFRENGYAPEKVFQQQEDTITYEEEVQKFYADKQLHFTPQKFRQEIFGENEAKITYDPIYQDWIERKARDVIKEKLDDKQREIPRSFEHYRAVVAIEQAKSDLDQFNYNLLLKKILADKQSQFIESINEINDSVDYLVGETSNQANRANFNVAGQAYKAELYSACLDSKPSYRNESFNTKINMATSKFYKKLSTNHEGNTGFKAFFQPVFKHIYQHLVRLARIFTVCPSKNEHVINKSQHLKALKSNLLSLATGRENASTTAPQSFKEQYQRCLPVESCPQLEAMQSPLCPAGMY